MNEFEKRARELALANGHKNPDEVIVCVGHRREPVWKFYLEDAVEQVLRVQAGMKYRQALNPYQS